MFDTGRNSPNTYLDEIVMFEKRLQGTLEGRYELYEQSQGKGYLHFGNLCEVCKPLTWSKKRKKGREREEGR